MNYASFKGVIFEHYDPKRQAVSRACALSGKKKPQKKTPAGLFQLLLTFDAL
jgi:hypothetical protein